MPPICCRSSFWISSAATATGRFSSIISEFFPIFAELAGARLRAGVALDGHSFAAQLRGQSGTPREWVYCCGFQRS